MDFSMMSLRLKVEFINIKDVYSCDEHLACNYRLNSYKPQQGDRIAIFKMGWESLNDYVLFDWAAECSKRNEDLTVIFNKQNLPKQPQDLDELYQFCYVSQENTVQGVSTPFQITLGSSSATTSTSTTTKLPDIAQTSTICQQMLQNKDREILKLKEENAILKETLKALHEQRKLTKIQDYDKDIAELKKVTNVLKTIVVEQSKEIIALKEQMQKDRMIFEQFAKEKDIVDKKLEVLTRQATDHSGLVKEIVNFTLDDLKPLPSFPL